MSDDFELVDGNDPASDAFHLNELKRMVGSNLPKLLSNLSSCCDLCNFSANSILHARLDALKSVYRKYEDDINKQNVKVLPETGEPIQTILSIIDQENSRTTALDSEIADLCSSIASNKEIIRQLIIGINDEHRLINEMRNRMTKLNSFMERQMKKYEALDSEIELLEAHFSNVEKSLSINPVDRKSGKFSIDGFIFQISANFELSILSTKALHRIVDIHASIRHRLKMKDILLFPIADLGAMTLRMTSLYSQCFVSIKYHIEAHSYEKLLALKSPWKMNLEGQWKNEFQYDISILSVLFLVCANILTFLEWRNLCGFDDQGFSFLSMSASDYLDLLQFYRHFLLTGKAMVLWLGSFEKLHNSSPINELLSLLSYSELSLSCSIAEVEGRLESLLWKSCYLIFFVHEKLQN